MTTERIEGQSGTQSAPQIGPIEQELEGRLVVSEVRPINVEDAEEVQDVFRILNQSDKWGHFSEPPSKPKHLLRKREGETRLVALNRLGEVVATGMIRDAQPNQHDHFL